MSRSTGVWLAGLVLLGCHGGGTGASATFGVGGSVDPSGPGGPVTDGGEAPTGGGDATGSIGSAGTGMASGSTGAGGEPTGGDMTGAATADPTTGEGPASGGVEAGSSGGGEGTGGPSPPPSKEPPPCVPVKCSGKLYDCGDCEDNDGDGLVDAADPECVGPCDDREDAFATGVPGDNVDPCKQDCFFDGNSGQGKDCTWNLKCDPLEPSPDACAYDEGFKCPEPKGDDCLLTCTVPNGCDCFGCCTVSVGGQAHDIYIGDPACSLAHFDQCMACTKVKTCENTCDHEGCEVCFGEAEPPAGCTEPKCEDGLDPCVNSVCPQGFYCAPGSGCCFPAPG